MGVKPSVGVFLRDPSPYLREFRRKPRKTPNGLVNKRNRGIEPGTSRLPILEHKIAQPLVGPRMDNLTSMHCLGFEPETFGAAASLT